MANITKAQIRSRKNKLYEKLDELLADLYDLRDAIEELKDEVEDESASIEPYEGCNDLTNEQTERQEWLEAAAESLDSAYSNIDEVLDNLNYAETDLEEID